MVKRIAIVDLLFHWPPLGGSWVDVKELASCLKNMGWEVKIFAPLFTDFFPRGSLKKPLPFPVELISFNRFSFNFKEVPKRFKKAIDEYSPDVVLITDGYFLKPYLVEALQKYPVFLRFYAYEIMCPLNNFTRWGTTLYCENNILKDQKRCIACFGRKNRYIKDASGFLFGGKNKIRLHFFQEFIFAKAFSKNYTVTLKEALKESKGIIVYNRFIKNILEKFTSTNIHIIPSGIDTSVFTPSKRKNTLHTPSSKPILNISMIGRVNDPVKGFHILDRALRLISLHRDDFLLVVTNELPMKCHENYIRPVGWISPSLLPKLYKEIDICVAPSIWHEPFGIGVLEAMASGKPVLASRVGGMQDTVIDGVTGLMFEPGHVEELSEKLEILMDDPILREKLGEAGRKRTVDMYDWKKIVKKYYLPLFEK